MIELETVLRLLHDKYNWNLTNSLTDTGQRLVQDAILVYDNIKYPNKKLYFKIFKWKFEIHIIKTFNAKD
jgi:hypothetical protein